VLPAPFVGVDRCLHRLAAYFGLRQPRARTSLRVMQECSERRLHPPAWRRGDPAGCDQVVPRIRRDPRSPDTVQVDQCCAKVRRDRPPDRRRRHCLHVFVGHAAVASFRGVTAQLRAGRSNNHPAFFAILIGSAAFLPH
jgi:hypothetical protein